MLHAGLCTNIPLAAEEKALASNSSCFAFVELFAGIGGFRWALEARES